MPDLRSILKMAEEAANATIGQQAKHRRKPPKRFVGVGSSGTALLLSWIGATAAHPLSHAAHSAGNFFTHDPIYAGVVMVMGLLWPRLSRTITKRGK